MAGAHAADQVGVRGVHAGVEHHDGRRAARGDDAVRLVPADLRQRPLQRVAGVVRGAGRGQLAGRLCTLHHLEALVGGQHLGLRIGRHVDDARANLRERPDALPAARFDRRLDVGGAGAGFELDQQRHVAGCRRGGRRGGRRSRRGHRHSDQHLLEDQRKNGEKCQEPAERPRRPTSHGTPPPPKRTGGRTAPGRPAQRCANWICRGRSKPEHGARVWMACAVECVVPCS